MRKRMLLLLLVPVFLAFSGCNANLSKYLSPKKPAGNSKQEVALTTDQAKEKVLNFINSQLMQGGQKAEIKDITEQGSLFRIAVLADGQEIETYLSKDGKMFFPNAMNIDEITQKKQETQADAQEKNKNVEKKDVPDVELFVMSYCPYGTQIEKGILPVLDVLKNKIKFSLKFVNYLMHDKKELDENLRQYCIQKNNPDKLNPYLKCFLKKGQGTESQCLDTAGISAGQIDACVSSTDTQFKITEKFNDKGQWKNGQFPPFDVDLEANQKYQVQGSPTLIVNGTDVSSGRDSAGILAAICNGFSNPPEACSQELSATAPSAGFGEGTGTNSEAGCGS